jgi:hypothetical protein
VIVSCSLEGVPGRGRSYAERDETRREHLAELQLHYGLRSFSIGQYRSLAAWLMPTALQTDRGVVLVQAGIDELRRISHPQGACATRRGKWRASDLSKYVADGRLFQLVASSDQ